MSLAAGMRLGRYEIRSPLGAGGMAEVYLAEDLQLGRRVAIKVLPPETTSNEHARKRLIREARAAATLDHPHICPVYEVGEADGHRFIAMQYVPGETLDVRLTRTPLELKDALTIGSEVADALAEAHERGIIHRDIKPSNVMITPRGQAIVLDFGLAKLMQEREHGLDEAETASLLTGPGALMGTVPYMSPEQVRGDALDGRSDIFSLGVMLYEMLSGQRPFADKSSAAIASAILTREPQPLARFAPGIPAELERIVGKTLRKNPNERYQTAKDLLIDLRTLRDEREFQRRLERSSPPAAGPAAPASVVDAPPSGAAAARSSSLTAVDVAPETPEISVAAGADRRARTVSGRTGAIAIAALVVLAAAGWFVWRGVNVRRAAALLPRVEALAQAKDYFGAYDLAAAAEQYAPADRTLARVMPTISMPISVATKPEGAQVYLRRFSPDASGALPPRQLVGTTPLTELRVARGEYVLGIEKDGYAPTERTVSGADLHTGTLTVMPPPVRVDQSLVVLAQMPARMVSVPGGEYRLVAWSRPTDRRVRLNDYFIDKYEVTNREFKEFINAGGYLKKEFWKHPFVKDGRTIPWDEAMKAFTDRTGLPGPRGWSSQNVPEGKADHPVTDITWYEAAAYAAFRGKQLPTVFQWERAARNGASAPLVNYMPWGVFYPGDTLEHRANFENNGTLPVDSSEFGMSPFGAYNMAGNVSEWTLNDTSEGFVATGGAWGEPTYVFAEYGMRPGFFSSNKLGFRCAQTAAGATGDQGAMRIEIKQEIPVYTASSDSSFKTWLASYRYEKTPLDPKVEDVKNTPEWKREKITFNGADGERAIAYLYLPNNVSRPLTVIHYVPAGDVDGGLRSLPDSMDDRLAPFIKSGRAAFGVVLKGYIERLRPQGATEPDPATVEYLETIVNRVTDLRRGLDYLDTRLDVDASRVAFFGPSAGAQIGLILAAVETRYRAVVLVGAGLPKHYVRWIAEANPINFSAHIRGPKLLIQGRYDEDTPFRTMAEPLYKLLSEPKRLALYDGGHVPPLEFLMPTLTTWLDDTLGAVRRE
jgi:formylglycine-generating enzyme required for sulfatase activity